MNVFTATSDKIKSLGQGSKRGEAKKAAAAEKAKADEATQAASSRFMENQLKDRADKAREVSDNAGTDSSAGTDSTAGPAGA